MDVGLALAAGSSSAAPQAPELPPPAPPAPNSIAAQLAAPWRHLPNPVSDQQFKQDKAYCSMMSDMAPPDAGSIELKRKVTFLDCLRSKGYEPILSSEGQEAVTKPRVGYP
jgi:hypothetical protein